jgi:NAD(P)-dependent dehydrogenase (short-subunit alcohol dehydrogenase family)
MVDVAIVTGAAGALGAEVARKLSSLGCKVVLVDSEHGAARLRDLAATMGGASIVAGDITAEATWAEAMPRIERELGAPPSLGALIAGAWRGGAPLYEEPNDDTWRTMMAANVDTVHTTLRAILPGMVARKRGPRRRPTGDECACCRLRRLESGRRGAGAGRRGRSARAWCPHQRRASEHPGYPRQPSVDAEGRPEPMGFPAFRRRRYRLPSW